jgi:probable phosphoglycerate mutase
MAGLGDIWLIRHGETEWSASGKHTGRTDIPLTDAGRERAVRVGKFLAGHSFAAVCTSPMRRARDTARLAGFEDATVDDDLLEWDYGAYEGRTTADIRASQPDWSVWTSPMKNGESLAELGERARRAMQSAVAAGGDVAIFSHGHFLRVLAATWAGLSPSCGMVLRLDTGAVSILGYERETRVLRLWNSTPGESYKKM